MRQQLRIQRAGGGKGLLLCGHAREIVRADVHVARAQRAEVGGLHGLQKLVQPQVEGGALHQQPPEYAVVRHRAVHGVERAGIICDIDLKKVDADGIPTAGSALVFAQ